MSKNENMEKIMSSLENFDKKENIVYFLTYDTKNNPRASIKYIYDLALTLNNNGINSKIIVEDKNYSGVKSWLGDKYDSLEVLNIKEDKIELRLEDAIVVPEYYSNVLEQLTNVKSIKIMLVQQKNFIYETLPIGSKWADYGFDKVITTTENCKEYISNFFPESLVFIIPPIIEDVFKPSDAPLKPYIAISCRDRSVNTRIISEFYLKYPQLRWITFKDMIKLSYDEFAENLKECMVSVWIDDDSTFGTFPLESMKCKVPVIGKIPDTEPDWLGENGFWSYDLNKIVEILGTYVLAWIDGVELTDEIINKMKETLLTYDKSVIEKSILSVFNSLLNKRKEVLEKTLDKIKEVETT